MGIFEKQYDTIVVGGGLAGLSCAALLAKGGQKVVVLEKNQRLGGYAVSYITKGHRFDIAIQAIGGCAPGGIIYKVLEEIDCKDRVKFLRCEPARAYYTDKGRPPWIQPGNSSGIEKDLCSAYPDYREAIERFFSTCSGILAELERIALRGFKKAAFGFSRQYPLLYRYSDYTLMQFLDELGMPEDLQFLVSARSGYCMLNPDRLSLVGFACTETTYSQGAWQVEGGIERLTDTFAQAVEEQGGTIKRGSEVFSIHTKQGKVNGVSTRNGGSFSAPRVVLASAVQPALQHWLDKPDLIPQRYFNRLSKMEMTGSYYIAYYSIPEEAAKGLYPNIEVREGPRKILKGWHPDSYYMLLPSLVDPSAAPPGSHCLCLSLPCPAGLNLRGEDQKQCRQYLEQAVESRFSQLRDMLSFLFHLNPSHLSAITANPGGSAYGWAQLPGQAGIKRLNFKTPVPGLYLVGHWTMPGGGIAGVITSGRICSQAIITEGDTL